MREEENVPLGSAPQVGDVPPKAAPARLAEAGALLVAVRLVARSPGITPWRAIRFEAGARGLAWEVAG